MPAPDSCGCVKRQQAADGFKLFDAILDGMEAEELEYLEYERSLSESTGSMNSGDDREPATVATLEDRLREMRLAKSEATHQNAQNLSGTLRDAKTPMAAGSATAASPQSCPPLAPRDKVRGLEVHIALLELTDTNWDQITGKAVAYPHVGKASWMTPSEPRSRAHLPPPLSRQRSQEAIANLSRYAASIALSLHVLH